LTWIFDDSEIPDPFGRGEKAVAFLRALKHPKSRLPGQAFQLSRWQERIVRRIYGPCREDGQRIVRTVVIILPRGNRKTALGAALALIHAVGPERIGGGQVVCAASDREQARIAFEEAVSIVQSVPQISSRLQFANYRHQFRHPLTGSILRAISCDAGRAHGGTPTFVLADELHAWQKRDLWEVLRTGLVKTPGTLMVVISTAGRGQNNVAFDIVDYARKVARGEVDDPSMLPILFETPADADWQDEAVWHAVNPGLADGFPDIDGLRQLAREAANRPADRDAFRQLHLNVWLDYSAAPFVEMNIYDEGAGPVDLDEFDADQTPCWLGVDLSTNHDLTAVVAVWGDSETGYSVHPWFFCPADNLQRRADRDGVPYPLWAEDELIIPTPGNVVDFRVIEEHIRELCGRFNVQEIAFDPALGRNMMQDLAEDGFPAIEMRQGWVTMAPAVKETERAIIGRKFRHGGHPILRWHFSNISVERDKAGNMSFHKGKSKDRIDGAVAAAMAIGRASAGQTSRSSYDDADEDFENWAFA
jgi:phage terminase large subunit-like protein